MNSPFLSVNLHFNQKKETLVEKIEVEEKEAARTSRARQRLEVEREKVKKSMDTTTKRRVAAEIAVTKVERAIQDILKDIVLLLLVYVDQLQIFTRKLSI